MRNSEGELIALSAENRPVPRRAARQPRKKRLNFFLEALDCSPFEYIFLKCRPGRDDAQTLCGKAQERAFRHFQSLGGRSL